MTATLEPVGVPSTIDPDLDEAIAAAIEAELYNLHTGLPAKVLRFDPSTQSCVVQPLIKRQAINDDEMIEQVAIPPIYNVPVIYPAGGGWSITWPLAVEDIVYLAFAQRSLDTFLETPPGTPAAPMQPSDLVDTRKHSLTDAIAIPGLRPRVGAIAGISLTDLRIANTEGTVSIVLGADAVNITAPVVNVNSGGAAASQHMVLGEALLAYLSTLVLPVVGATPLPGVPAVLAGPPAAPPPTSLLSASALVSP